MDNGITINLNNYRAINNGKVSRVFIGRDIGKYVRVSSQIDRMESLYDVIKIIIPKDVYSITPSFLEEFLVNIFRKLGMKRFFEKVKFISESGYQYESSLFETAERILSGKSQFIL